MTNSRSLNLVTAAHISVNDPLVEKADWFQGKPELKVLHFYKECSTFTLLFMTNVSQGVGAAS